jgi:hypothetical protein
VLNFAGFSLLVMCIRSASVFTVSGVHDDSSLKLKVSVELCELFYFRLVRFLMLSIALQMQIGVRHFSSSGTYLILMQFLIFVCM